jgi:predicted DNA binding CopG/RHH family protein
MNNSQLKARLTKNRPMTSITLRIPTDVIEDLKRVAPHRGFSGYQTLMRAYISQGLRDDLENLERLPGRVTE